MSLSTAPPQTAHLTRDTVPYLPGTSIPCAARLAGNELPFTPADPVLDAIREAIPDLHRYPDHSAAELVAAIAGHYVIPADQVLVGNGSSAVLAQLLAAHCPSPAADNVLFGWPAFTAYPNLTASAGAAQLRVPLTPDGELDLEAMLDALLPTTRVILLSHPHNPTGTALDHDAFRRFLDRIPPHVLVILDEAYIEFGAPTVLDGLQLFREYACDDRDNLAVVRTFSKGFGLAGLRVGYAITSAARAALVRAAAPPFEINTLAQVGAVAALRHAKLAHETIAVIVDERDRVHAQLLDAGYRVPRSEANFLWLPVGAHALGLAQHCLSYDVAVMAYPESGVRVTIGTRSQNDRFLIAARAFAPIGQA